VGLETHWLSNYQLLNIFDPVYGLIPDVDPDDLPLARNIDVQTNRLGVYVQDQIAFTNNLKLLAGLRYDTVEQTTTNGPTEFDTTGSESSQLEPGEPFTIIGSISVQF
jgi:iron complex outermembrane receptor protein